MVLHVLPDKKQAIIGASLLGTSMKGFLHSLTLGSFKLDTFWKAAYMIGIFANTCIY
jgi:hypothetical protein